jgi:hypothetical protein
VRLGHVLSDQTIKKNEVKGHKSTKRHKTTQNETKRHKKTQNDKKKKQNRTKTKQKE